MTVTDTPLHAAAGPVATGVTTHLRWRSDAVVDLPEVGAAGPVSVTVGSERLVLPGLRPGTRRALTALVASAEEAELHRLVATDPPALAEWVAVLAALQRTNLLSVALSSAGRPLATLEPLATTPPPARPGPSGRLTLSRFAHLRPAGGAAVLEGAGARGAVLVADPRVGALVVELASGVDAAALRPGTAGLGAAETAAVVRLITGAGLLAPAGEAAGCDPAPTAALGWSFADRLFHHRSRIGPEVRAYGATWPLEGRRPPLPALKAVRGPTLPLPAPDPAAVAAADLPLEVALTRRRSIRDYDEAHPITAAQLGELLHRSQRVLGVTTAEHCERIRRPYPGAGGLGELEIYPVVARCAGLDAGLYRYDAAGHTLEIVGAPGPATERLLAGAAGATGRTEAPQVLLAVTARWGRVMWKYESMAYALVLKDLGVLFQTLYLVATAMGLAPCAVGGGETGILEVAAGLDPDEESVVGEFILGGRPAGPA